MEAKDGNAGFVPGQRAIFIRSMNGHNYGKIVTIVCEFPAMDAAKVGDLVKDPNRNILWVKGANAKRTWIVESMGGPIVYIHNGVEKGWDIGPVPEHYLHPLDDFDQDESLWKTSTIEKTKTEPSDLAVIE